jgi:hypothetical protein
MAKVELTLTLHKKAWVSPLLEAGAYACALTSIVSWRCAHWLSEGLTSVVAKHGFRIKGNS